MERDKLADLDGARKETYHLTDGELARMVTDGNKAALETLYDRHARPAINLAYRIVGQLELAEEVAQEVFLRFWERPWLYEPERGQFVTWLLASVRHRAINERQRSAFRYNVSADRPLETADGEITLLEHLHDESPELYELVWVNQQRQAVRAALEQLNAAQRQVIELAYFNGLSQGEIARTLQEPLGTIKTRIRLAMQKLRTTLGAYHSNEILPKVE